MKILILEATPRNDLSLNEEIRELEAVIERARDREQFAIKTKLAVRSTDLQQSILEFEPNIIHFCGHGTGEGGLVFRDKKIGADVLSNLFALFKEHLQCVVLNACYSETQANEIIKHIDYVIGMNQAIRDDAAIAFSIGFYQALAYGRSIEDAFKFGKNAIQLTIGDNAMARNAIIKEIRKLVPIDNASEYENIIIPEYLKPTLHKNLNIARKQGKKTSMSMKHDEITNIRIQELKQDIDHLMKNYKLLTQQARFIHNSAQQNDLTQQALQLYKQAETKQQELEKLLTSSTNKEINEQHLNLEKELCKFNFKSTIDKINNICKRFDDNNLTALFLLENSFSNGGEHFTHRFKYFLKQQTSESRFRHCIINISSIEGTKEIDLLRKVSRYFTINNSSVSIQEYTRSIILRICESIEYSNQILFLDFSGFEYLLEEPTTISWFINDFWCTLHQQFTEFLTQQEFNKVKLICLLKTDESIPNYYIPTSLCCNHDDFKQPSVVKLEISKCNQKEIEDFLALPNLSCKTVRN